VRLEDAQNSDDRGMTQLVSSTQNPASAVERGAAIHSTNPLAEGRLAVTSGISANPPQVRPPNTTHFPVQTWDFISPVASSARCRPTNSANIPSLSIETLGSSAASASVRSRAAACARLSVVRRRLPPTLPLQRQQSKRPPPGRTWDRNTLQCECGPIKPQVEIIVDDRRSDVRRISCRRTQSRARRGGSGLWG